MAPSYTFICYQLVYEHSGRGTRTLGHFLSSVSIYTCPAFVLKILPLTSMELYVHEAMLELKPYMNTGRDKHSIHYS